MPEEKYYKAILAKYEFKDKFGHSLERVTDYLNLLAELERLREADNHCCLDRGWTR
jgi:hypothetical protein